MPEYMTKANEYVGNRTVFIREIASGGNPTVVVRDAGGVDLVEIDLEDIVSAAYKRGVYHAPEPEPSDCTEEVDDAIIDHMEYQPSEVTCSKCGEDLSYVATTQYNNLSIEVDPCGCVEEAMPE